MLQLQNAPVGGSASQIAVSSNVRVTHARTSEVLVTNIYTCISYNRILIGFELSKSFAILILVSII